MKTVIIILLVSLSTIAHGQSLVEEPINTGNIITYFQDYDLSELLNPNLKYNGTIGKSARRIQIHFTSVLKSSNPFVYFVSGKSKVDNNIFSFSGEIVLTHATKTSNEIISESMADEVNRENGLIEGKYFFRELSKEKSTGIFSGDVKIKWAFDEHKQPVKASGYYLRFPFSLVYEGTWQSYNTGNSLTCCWSDYKIPCAPDDFNVSDGPDLIPNPKYSGVGWDDLRIIFTESPNSESWKKAHLTESKKWWE